MKKHLVTCTLALIVGVLGFAVSGIAVAGNGNPSPPGQGDCSHGNTGKDCKNDPQSDNGKDCEAHGNNGGVNEDHCKGEETTPTDTTPTETTPTDTTPTETTPTETTPTETTPSETTPTQTVPNETRTETSSSSTTPSATVPQETTASEPAPAEESPSASAPKPQQFTPPTAKAAKKSEVRGVSTSEPKPSTKAQKAPFTL